MRGDGGSRVREESAMRRAMFRTLMGAIALITLIAWAALGVSAAHENANRLTFAPLPDSSAPAGAGVGTIEFRGGDGSGSRWTATFRFMGLRPDTRYTVTVQGRFGDDGTAEAAAFTEICTFRTDTGGAGGCWTYALGLRRLGVAQLRLGDAPGPPALQATRAAGGPGAIESAPNRFAPPR